MVRIGVDNLDNAPFAPPDRLTDGRYVIVEVLDSTRFIVKKDDGMETKTFQVRLAGVEPARGNRDSANRFVRKFLNQEPAVHLQFDRFRLDDDGVAVAYLSIQNRNLAIELARKGFAKPKNIIGNSPSIQRKIKLAFEESQSEQIAGFGQKADDSNVR